MGMWQRHRERQAGKYQKVVAQQQAQLLQQQTAMAQQQATAAPPQPQPVNTQATWQAGYQAGKRAGWQEGWRAGQADLIDALKTGRVRWENLAR